MRRGIIIGAVAAVGLGYLIWRKTRDRLSSYESSTDVRSGTFGALGALGTASLKVILVDEHGLTTHGTITIKQGSTVKTCVTSGGTCTLTGLASGTWAVSAKSTYGKTTVTKYVAAGVLQNLTVQIDTTGPVTRDGCPPCPPCSQTVATGRVFSL